MQSFTRDPRTKEELLDRILRYDFEGDIRQIGAEPARIERAGPNRLTLEFPRSGVKFEVSIHRPRSEDRQAQATPSERSFASTEPEGPPARTTASAPTSRKNQRRQTRKGRQTVEHRWEV